MLLLAKQFRSLSYVINSCLLMSPHILRPDRIYEGMNIAGAIGFTEGQRATLKALGAVE